MTSAEIKARLDAFIPWFRSRGGFIHPAVELVYDPDRGVHLRIKRNVWRPAGLRDITYTLPRGTLVISCPHSASLSALNAYGLPPFFPILLPNFTIKDKNFFTRLQQEARPQFVAAVWLCAHWLAGENSWWREYLDILPTFPLPQDEDAGVDKERRGLGEVDSPVWWTEEELAWIKGTNLDRGRTDLERVWREEWERWGIEVRTWVETRGWELDWPLLKWSLTILGSRAFSSSQIAAVPSALQTYNPDMLLYPGVDSLNHNPLTKNRWFCGSQDFGIECEDTLGLGDEVWNPYGGKGNGELLLSYGFALPNNPCDTFALRLPQPPHPFIAVVEAAQQLPSSDSAASPTSTQPTATGPSPMTPHNTPPAYSLPHNTYYLRSSSRFSTLESHYPVACTTSTTDPPATTPTHLAAFPSLLLSTLILSLSHPHELLPLQTHPDRYSPETIYTDLGARPLFATTSLLLARLKMELGRLDALVAANDEKSVGVAKRTKRSARRWQNVRTLLDGQRGILLENITRIEWWIVRFLSHTSPSSLSTPSTPSSFTSTSTSVPKTLTLPTALTLLPSLSPRHSSAFISSIESLFGTCDVEALRQAECEEEVWVLWVGVVVGFLFRGVEGVGGAPGWLLNWLQFLRRTYNFPLYVNNPSSTSISLSPPPLEEREEEEDDTTTQMTSYIASLISSISLAETTPGTQLYDPNHWTSSFIRGCVRVVRGQGVFVRLRVGLRIEVDGKDGEEDDGADGDGEEGEGEEIAEEEERDVLVLFVGGVGTDHDNN